LKLPHSGEALREQIQIDEEKVEVMSSKLGADSRPSNRQHVSFKQDPLQIEVYERDANTVARLEWGAPYKVATKLFTNITKTSWQAGFDSTKQGHDGPNLHALAHVSRVGIKFLER